MKKAKIDIRTFQAFDWHPNTSKKCDALRVISLDFVVPSSAPCSGGVLALDDIAMTGLINPAPDFEEAGVELKVTPYRQLLMKRTARLFMMERASAIRIPS